MNKKIGIGIVAILAVMMLVLTGCTGRTFVITQDTGNDDNKQPGYLDRPDSATLTLNAFTGSWGKEGARTEVYPVYTIFKHDGTGKTTLVSDVAANTTTGIVEGDVVDIYCTGAAYYCDPVLDFKIDSVSPTAEITAYTVAATTDLVLAGYDEDENALTADDHANNTADYAGGDVVANDNQDYYVKLSQTGANKNFNLNEICTFILGDEADKFELVGLSAEMVAAGYDFSEAKTVPDKLDSTAITHYDDTNASTSEKGWKKCYTLNKPFMMNENTNTGKLHFVFDSDDTTGTTANGDTYIGVGVLDGSYSVDKDGVPTFGSFMDDDVEDAGTVGLDENLETTANGLDVVLAIEPQ